jgi:hypothetical protein
MYYFTPLALLSLHWSQGPSRQQSSQMSSPCRLLPSSHELQEGNRRSADLGLVHLLGHRETHGHQRR